MLTNHHAMRHFQLSIFLHFIGRGLYSVFVPIIMLQNGYSLRLVLIFLLLSAVVTIATSTAAVRYWSERRVIFFHLLGILAEIALLILLSTREYSLPIFVGLLTFEALYFTFYYLAYFSILSHFNTKEKTGTNVGNTQIAVHLAGIAVPLLGALLLNQSVLALSVVAVVFLSASLIPIFRLSRVDINGERQPKIQWHKVKKEALEYMILSAIEIVVFTLWAIHLYLSGFTLIDVATIPVAEALVRVNITQNLKAKIQALRYREKIKQLALLFIILTSLYRFALPHHVLATNLLFGLFYMLLNLTIETDVFEKLKGYRAYHAAAALSIIAFAARSVVVVLALFIGLQYTLLLPIPLALIYFFLAPAFKKRAV